MTNKKQNGQALIETLFTSLCMFAFFVFMASAFYLYYAKAISSYHSHRALLCIEELGTKVSECESILNKRLNESLFFKEKLSITLSKNRHENQASVAFTFYKRDFNWQKKIRVKVQ